MRNGVKGNEMLTTGTKKKFNARQSLFRRILVVMTLAAISIVIVVIGLFRLSAQRRFENKYDVAFKNLNIYAKTVAAELDQLGESELQNAINLLLLDRGILTRVRFADGRTMIVPWQRAVGVFAEAESKDSWMYAKDGVSLAIVKGTAVLRVGALAGSKERDYFFTIQRTDSFDFDERILFLGVLLPLLVIWLLYRSVRQMLLPIRTLQNGVDSVSQGNLAVQLDESGSDELSVLARSFNRMTLELKRMIAAREELLLGVSHELRTPLTRARIAVEMLPDSNRRQQLEADMREMSLLVDELLEFGRLRGGLVLNKEKCFVHEVLSDIEQLALSFPQFQLSKAKLTLDASASVRAVSAEVDKLRFARILRNLFENSIRYATGPDKVLQIELLVAVQEEQLVFLFRDNGEGIKELDRERVFEPFARLELSRSREFGGLGLGLSLARSIVEAHGGKLALTRFAPQGVEFRMSIPISRHLDCEVKYDNPTSER